LRPSAEFGFEIVGPQAAVLSHENPDDNLVVKAARSLAELTGNRLNVHLTLIKKLPLASGIGGGSSDAAAALRVLAQYWGLAKDDPRIEEAAARHGQDVPVCVKVENNYMTATGVAPAPKLPRAHIVLVNPNKALSTPSVYKEYRNGGDAFSPLSRLAQAPINLEELIGALQSRGNDLYAPACRLMPEIADIIEVLRKTENCLLARMSGSGATCFGIYVDAISAQVAAEKIRVEHSTWWIEPGEINI